MSLLAELNTIIEPLGIPVETGIFSETPPDRYAVLTPLSDSYELFSDNAPGQDIEEVRVSLFDKGNYLAVKKRMESEILAAGITITDRRYIGHEDDTGYHHYAIDVAKNYETQEE
jgi:hypothetical protein